MSQKKLFLSPQESKDDVDLPGSKAMSESSNAIFEDPRCHSEYMRANSQPTWSVASVPLSSSCDTAKDSSGRAETSHRMYLSRDVVEVVLLNCDHCLLLYQQLRLHYHPIS